MVVRSKFSKINGFDEVIKRISKDIPVFFCKDGVFHNANIFVLERKGSLESLEDFFRRFGISDFYSAVFYKIQKPLVAMPLHFLSSGERVTNTPLSGNLALVHFSRNENVEKVPFDDNSVQHGNIDHGKVIYLFNRANKNPAF